MWLLTLTDPLLELMKTGLLPAVIVVILPLFALGAGRAGRGVPVGAGRRPVVPCAYDRTAGIRPRAWSLAIRANGSGRIAFLAGQPVRGYMLFPAPTSFLFLLISYVTLDLGMEVGGSGRITSYRAMTELAWPESEFETRGD